MVFKELAYSVATLLESLFLPFKALIACWNVFQLKTEFYGRNVVLYPLKGLLYLIASPILLLLALDGVLKEYGYSLKGITLSTLSVVGVLLVGIVTLFASLENDQ